MNTIEDIIEWIKDYDNPDDNIEKFTAELIQMITDMDYVASNGGEAVGYAGLIGYSKDVKSAIYLTVENLTGNSNGKYCFINDGVNILNNREFYDILYNAIGEKNTKIIIDGDENSDGTRNKHSFGNNLSLNDVVSQNFMAANASGDVMLLIEESARPDSVLGTTEIPQLMRDPKVTHILGIPKDSLIGFTDEERFQILKEKSLIMQAGASIYRGVVEDELGNKKVVEYLCLENTPYADKFKVEIPSGFERVCTYYERLQENGINLLTDKQLMDKYGIFSENFSQESLDAIRIGEYRGEGARLRFGYDSSGKLTWAELLDCTIPQGDSAGGKEYFYETSVSEINKLIKQNNGNFGNSSHLTDLQKIYSLQLENDINEFEEYIIKNIGGEKDTSNRLLEIIQRGTKTVDFISSNVDESTLTQREVSFIKLISGMNGYTEGEEVINIVRNITDVAVYENAVSNEELSIVKRILDFVDNVVDEKLVSLEQIRKIEEYRNAYNFACAWNQLPDKFKTNKQLYEALIKLNENEAVFKDYSVVNNNMWDDMISCAQNIEKYSKITSKINKIGGGIAAVMLVIETINTVNDISNMIADGEYDQLSDYMTYKTSNILGYGMVGVACGAFISSGLGTAITGVLAASGPVGIVAALVFTYVVPYLITSAIGEEVSEAIYNCFKGAVEFTEDLIDGVGDVVDAIIDWWDSLWGNSKKVKVDPLIIDLGGDGFAISSKAAGANFDLDGNGFAEKINWTSSEGILSLDLNENGTIDNGGELFGDKTLLANGKYAANGFEALAQYDTNNDGVIDTNDEIFSRLLVWIDKNADGISTSDELKHLDELGISAIYLNYEDANLETNKETKVSHTAKVEFKDGTSTDIGELWVSSNKIKTKDTTKVEISEEIKALPEVNGVGNIRSLRTAMQLDSTGTIKGLVKGFIESNDKAERKEIIDKLLVNLAGAGAVGKNSRGSYFDGQKLAILESFLGEKFVGVNGSNPNSEAATRLEKLYNSIVERYYYELLIKGTSLGSYAILLNKCKKGTNNKYDMSILFNYLQFNIKNKLADEGTVEDINGYLIYTTRINGNVELYGEFRNYIAKNMPDYIESISSYDNSLVGNVTVSKNNITGAGEDDFIVGSTKNETISGGAGNDVIFAEAGNDVINGSYGDDEMYGEEGNDKLYGEYGDDLLVGGEGDDYLNGERGDDTYIVGIGTGHDQIYDAYGDNVIKFTDGVKPEDLIATYGADNSVIFTNRNSGDSIEIIRFRYDSDYRNYVMVFDDGTVMKMDDERSPLRNLEGTAKDDVLTPFYNNVKYHAGAGNDVINGSYGDDEMYGEEGNDKLYGEYGDDLLVGGEGDDYMNGERGDDTYIVGIGTGHDQIYDAYGDNVIKFTDGVKPEDLIATYGADNSVIFTNRNSGDSIEIIRFRYDSDYRNYVMVFDDGTVMKMDDERSPLRNLEGTAKDDVLTPFYNNVKYHAGAGNDVINGSYGDDEMYGEEGNDKLYGEYGDDLLVGGEGDDYLNGERGDDTYIVGIGTGHDQIYDAYGDNVIKFTDGVKPEDLIATYGADDSVIFTNRNSGDSIELLNFRYRAYYRNYQLVFDDGRTATVSSSEPKLIYEELPEDVLSTLCGADNTQSNGVYGVDTYTDLQANLLAQELSALSDSNNIYSTENNIAAVQSELFTEQFVVQ